MLTKTFRAPNMLVALQNVQSELGPDALIVSMREVPAGPIWAAWKKPGVEVIASKPSKSNTQDLPSGEKQAQQDLGKKKQPTQEELKREIENLKMLVAGQKIPFGPMAAPTEKTLDEASTKIHKEEKSKFDPSDFKYFPEDKEPLLEQISEKTNSAITKVKTVVIEQPKEPEIPPILLEIKQKLVSQGIHVALVDKIIETNIDALSPAILNDYGRLDRFIKHQLSACLPPSRKSLALVPSKIMTLVGSSGSGKTSSCAKLASFYMITMGKKVVWIEADTIRTSAISEARTYTETLGIPLFLAYTPQELTELIESQKDADLILVDTTSFNPRNEDSVVELGSFLSAIPGGSTYFVASATTKEQDLLEAEKTLKQFGLKGIIMTKMDETGSFGAAFNLLWQSKLPLYFFSAGHQIFGDLKHGNPEQLAASVLDGIFRK